LSGHLSDFQSALNSVDSLFEPIYGRLLSGDIFCGAGFIAPNTSDCRFKPIDTVLNVAELVPHIRLQPFNLVPNSPELLEN
jgi:hypothetical protein